MYLAAGYSVEVDVNSNHSEPDIDMHGLYFGDQAERGRQYNARASVEDFDALMEQYAQLAREVNRDCVGIYDLHYGPRSAQRLDIFPTRLAAQPAPVFIFIHGGYWRSQAKEDAPIMAKAFTQAGVALCALEYTLLPEATLAEVVCEVRQAVAWMVRHGGQYGIDPERIFVGGSSAGGHLAAMLAAQGWPSEYGLPQDVIKGLASLSGLYELGPLCDIAPGEWLQLHPDQTRRVSPLYHLPRRNLPVVLTVGGLETDGFKRQTDAYEQACTAQAVRVNRVEVAQCNHFNLLCELADPDSDLCEAVLNMVLNQA